MAYYVLKFNQLLDTSCHSHDPDTECENTKRLLTSTPDIRRINNKADHGWRCNIHPEFKMK